MMKTPHRFLRVVALAILLTLGTNDLAMATSSRSAGDYSLSTGPRFQLTSNKVHKNVRYTFTLVNGSSREILIRDVGRGGAGLQLLKTAGWTKTQMIRPHKSMRETLSFHVSNCSKVPKGSWPLTMEASWKLSKWRLVSLQPVSPGSLEWQTFLADSVCS